MEKALLRHLQTEVERQCQFAMIALQDMEESSANSDGKLFWYSVQNLMVAIGRISRLLWPPDPLFPKRGLELRESLAVDEDSPLAARTFAEHFEHFDKRLETWQVTSEQHRFFDSYTEPLDVLAETAPEDRLRGYDSENNAVLFHEDAYELGPVSGALEELQRRAEREMVIAPEQGSQNTEGEYFESTFPVPRDQPPLPTRTTPWRRVLSFLDYQTSLLSSRSPGSRVSPASQSIGSGVTRLRARYLSVSQIAPECVSCALRCAFRVHVSTVSSRTAVLTTSWPSQTSLPSASCWRWASSRSTCSIQLKLAHSERPPAAFSPRRRRSVWARSPSPGS